MPKPIQLILAALFGHIFGYGLFMISVHEERTAMSKMCGDMDDIVLCVALTDEYIGELEAGAYHAD